MTSKIKVDNIENQCGGAVVTKCGGTTTISGTVVKSNTLQASDAGNIISQSGTTITLGASGDTINLASGASQSGFGGTGTVDWQTGSIKTGTFVPVSGEGYFVDTSSGVSTANLPAGSAGAIVSFSDYTRTFQTNNLTITPNGSEKIGGVAANFVAQTEGQSITLVYVDGTEGWINTAESTGQSGLVPTFITATGGTITTVDTDYKVHTFTGPGTFTVCSVGNPIGSSTVDYLVVAGGGGGNRCNAGIPGGAGGAGGYRESPGTASGSYTVSPLGVAPAVALPVSVQPYTVTVGAGSSNAGGGNPSTFSTITSTAGGRGGEGINTNPGAGNPGQAGGSGGGGGSTPQLPNNGTGGAGNTPPTNPAQGSTGGGAFSFQGHSFGSGGGGGATTAGAGGGPATGGNGGTGGTSSINGTPTERAGGGGGSGRQPLGGTGNAGSATGGGGAGGTSSLTGSNATANTGGGGGGESSGTGAGTTGGSGIVIIRYKFQ